MGVWIAWLAGGIAALALGWLWPWLGAILMLPLAAFALCWPSAAAKHSRKNELAREQYPMLFAILKDEAERTRHHRRLRIFLAEDAGASAFIGRRYDGVLISPILLAILTKEELRQVFRHELAHLASPEVRRETRWRRLSARMYYANRAILGLLPAASPALFFAGRAFVRRQREYQRRMEPIRERQADDALDTADAAATFAKAAFAEWFAEETSKRRFSTLAGLRNAYDEMIAQKGKDWLRELEGQEALPDDPHPAFHRRAQAQCDPFKREIDPAWIREMNRIKPHPEG